MLRRAWGSVCRYLKQTDTLLMVLSLLICACGLVLIFSGCQSVKKVNPQRLILIQCIGIAAGFVGMINIQPGEVGKVIFIYTMASHMALLKDRKNHFLSILQLTLHMAVTAGAVFIISRDLGVTLMYPLIFITMLLIYGVSLWWMGAAGLCAAAALPVLWHFMDQGHRERILVVFDPAISEKRAWHAKQTVMAISNGQLTGDGYLHGARTQGGWIPEAHCDSIFAVCAEEFGFIGAMVLLALLTALVLRIFYDC